MKIYTERLADWRKQLAKWRVDHAAWRKAMSKLNQADKRALGLLQRSKE